MSDVLDLPIRTLLRDAHGAANGAGGGAARTAPAGAPAASAAPTSSAAPPADAPTLVREAVFALAARELAEFIVALPLERAAAALRERDPAAAVAGLLADAALEQTAAAA